MSAVDENKPAAGRNRKRRDSGARKQVYLSHEAHQMLSVAADGLGLTDLEYASAAISYFAERGLNPVSDRLREGMVIQTKIEALQSSTEKMLTALANRLFGWLAQHEKNLHADLFGFLRGHEKTLFDYLHAQGKNVHDHLADQEEMIFLPMMQSLYATQVEALYSRRLGEQIFLRDITRDPFKEKKLKDEFNNEYSERHDKFTEKREKDSNELFRTTLKS